MSSTSLSYNMAIVKGLCGVIWIAGDFSPSSILHKCGNHPIKWIGSRFNADNGKWLFN